MKAWRRRGGFYEKPFFKYGIFWLVFIALICFCFFCVYGDGTKTGKVSLHFFIELCGAIVVFFLLEKNIERVLELQNSRIKEVDRFPIEKFIKKIEKSKKIRILDFSLISLISRNENAYRNDFVEALAHAIARGSSVQIMLVRPSADTSIARAKQLIESKSVNQTDLVHFIDTSFRRIVDAREDNCRIELKFHDGHPRCAFYQTDSIIHLGFHSSKGLSASEPHLQIDADSEAGLFFETIFAEMWGDEKNIAEIDRDLLDQWLKDFRALLANSNL